MKQQHKHPTSATVVASKEKETPLRSYLTDTSFYLNVTSWTMDVLLIAGLVATGFAARAGHKWAAGRRGYYPIPG